jgi:hypothetical protein
MKYLLIFFLISFGSVQASELKPFKTDYCTNYVEGTLKHPTAWKHCCLMHDMYFWAGGTSQERVEADLGLKTCIEKTGHSLQAQIMYSAIRLSSHSPIKYPDKRWGNGWKDREDFVKLTDLEIEEIESELQSGYDFIDQEYKDLVLHTLKTR